MQIFITSATGYVGAAVATRLRAHGHSITALARSASSEQRLRNCGAEVVRGDLDRPETFLATVAAADAIVHTAFAYFPDGSENLALDMNSARLLSLAVGTGRVQRFVYTSNAYRPRLETEQLLFASAAGSSTAAVRVGMVYGGCGGGTIASLFASAHRARQLPYLQQAAENRWSLIQLDDLAELYARLVATTASGVFDAVDGQPLTVRRAFERVSAVCNVPASMQSETVVNSVLEQHTVDVMNLDVALYCARAQEIGWSPRYRSFDEGAASAYAEWCAQ